MKYFISDNELTHGSRWEFIPCRAETDGEAKEEFRAFVRHLSAHDFDRRDSLQLISAELDEDECVNLETMTVIEIAK